jgi:cell wall assembly regulator SMI1
MDEIRTQWQRLTSLLQALEPQALEQIRPGATERQIAACEAATQLQWPDDFKALLLISNGGLLLPGDQRLASLEQILGGWSGWADGSESFNEDEQAFNPDGGYPPPRTRGVPGHECLLPLDDEVNWGLYLDLSPGPTGRLGQIVCTSHGGFLEWVTWSVLDYLRLNADAMAHGRIKRGATEGWIEAASGRSWYGRTQWDAEGSAP